jgi:chemotaxis signal transduction protein
VPVESTVSVRSSSGLVDLPNPRPGVVGILPAEQPITVLSVLGSGRGHVLVLAAEGHTFGLLVEQVTGLSRIDKGDIGDAPDGQDEVLICGVIRRDGGIILLADPAKLAGRL